MPADRRCGTPEETKVLCTTETQPPRVGVVRGSRKFDWNGWRESCALIVRVDQAEEDYINVMVCCGCLARGGGRA